VDNHALTVAAQVNVKFDDIGANGQGFLKSGHGVFRCVTGGSPVAANGQPAGLTPQHLKQVK
jgi:hypothetical protein